MDRGRIIDTLGLVPGGSISVSDIQMVQWGRVLIFECVYRIASDVAPPDDPVMFRVAFKDCREIRYKVYAHIGAHEQGTVTPVADVVELALGKGNHRRDANILTNHFAVTISYGEIIVETDNESFYLVN